jgi:hypothetical protein
VEEDLRAMTNPQPTSEPLDLDAIEARCVHSTYRDAVTVIATDIPALLSECRRLREELKDAQDAAQGCMPWSMTVLKCQRDDAERERDEARLLLQHAKERADRSGLALQEARAEVLQLKGETASLQVEVRMRESERDEARTLLKKFENPFFERIEKLEAVARAAEGQVESLDPTEVTYDLRDALAALSAHRSKAEEKT